MMPGRRDETGDTAALWPCVFRIPIRRRQGVMHVCARQVEANVALAALDKAFLDEVREE